MWGLLQIALILVSLAGSILLLTWLYANIRSHFKYAVKPVLIMIAVCAGMGFLAILMVLVASLIGPPAEDWINVVPFGMIVASLLVWLVLPFGEPIIRRRRLKKAQAQAQ
jgi:hypothetical protein